MPIIRTKEEWWDTVFTHWDDILFMFQYYVGLDRPLFEGGPSMLAELTYLKQEKCASLLELIELIQEHFENDSTVISDLDLGIAQDTLLELTEQGSVLHLRERVRKDKGRGNDAEGLKMNEGLEEKLRLFKKIMVSGWSREIL